MTDSAVLAGLGERVARTRLQRNLTQAILAEEAGVSKRTLVRLEAGESTQLTNLIRILRALGLLGNLEALVPPPVPSPLEELRSQTRRRKRASGRIESAGGEAGGPGGGFAGKEWTWGDGQEPAS